MELFYVSNMQNDTLNIILRAFEIHGLNLGYIKTLIKGCTKLRGTLFVGLCLFDKLNYRNFFRCLC